MNNHFRNLIFAAFLYFGFFPQKTNCFSLSRLTVFSVQNCLIHGLCLFPKTVSPSYKIFHKKRLLLPLSKDGGIDVHLIPGIASLLVHTYKQELNTQPTEVVLSLFLITPLIRKVINYGASRYFGKKVGVDCNQDYNE